MYTRKGLLTVRVFVVCNENPATKNSRYHASASNLDMVDIGAE